MPHIYSIIVCTTTFAHSTQPHILQLSQNKTSSICIDTYITVSVYTNEYEAMLMPYIESGFFIIMIFWIICDVVCGCVWRNLNGVPLAYIYAYICKESVGKSNEQQ